VVVVMMVVMLVMVGMVLVMVAHVVVALVVVMVLVMVMVRLVMMIVVMIIVMLMIVMLVVVMLVVVMLVIMMLMIVMVTVVMPFVPFVPLVSFVALMAIVTAGATCGVSPSSSECRRTQKDGARPDDQAGDELSPVFHLRTLSTRLPSNFLNSLWYALKGGAGLSFDVAPPAQSPKNKISNVGARRSRGYTKILCVGR
jgi:hypothetical protein